MKFAVIAVLSSNSLQYQIFDLNWTAGGQLSDFTDFPDFRKNSKKNQQNKLFVFFYVFFLEYRSKMDGPHRGLCSTSTTATENDLFLKFFTFSGWTC